jgi:hypothetical protein
MKQRSKEALFISVSHHHVKRGCGISFCCEIQGAGSTTVDPIDLADMVAASDMIVTWNCWQQANIINQQARKILVFIQSSRLLRR